jgi:hypothetical protein
MSVPLVKESVKTLVRAKRQAEGVPSWLLARPDPTSETRNVVGADTTSWVSEPAWAVRGAAPPGLG